MNDSIRADFPFLQRDPTPIYFDNACMTLKPRQVIDALMEYYNDYPVCGGRSVHEAGMEVTVKVQESRDTFASTFGREPHEVIFTKNTTEAINLVAKGYPFEKGDRVLTTGYEHNSNIIPWLQMSRLKGIEVVPVPPAEDLTFDIEPFAEEISKGAAMVSVTHTSNLNGYTIPLDDVVKLAHENDVPVLVDGAQGAPHRRVDLGKCDVDLYALSVHKMLGPTGVGVLLGKEEYLTQLEALCPGGGTVTSASYSGYEPADLPDRLEGGLQDYAGIIASKAAVDYLMKVGPETIEEHERLLNTRATEGLLDIEGISIVPPADPALRAGIISFNVEGMNPHDIAILLDDIGNIMIRSGQHCVNTWFDSVSDKGITGTARASFYVYNTVEEVDIFLENMRGMTNFMGGEIA